jgi:hypothetical protein
MTLPHASLDVLHSADLVRELLREFGAVTLRVQGDCMAPAVVHGDRVTIEARPPRLGEVALLAADSGLRLHRVVWAPPRGRGRYRTCADRATALDLPLAREQVLGTLAASRDPVRGLRTCWTAARLWWRARRRRP